MAIYFVILFLVLILPCKKGNLSENINRYNRSRIVLKKSELYVGMVVLLLVLMAGLRDYTVGIDLQHHYFDDFKTYAVQPWRNISEHGIECGMFVLSKLIGIIRVDGQLFIFITSLISIGLTIRFFYWHSDDFKFSVALFIMYCLMYQYMNQIAQCIAISFVLFGYDYLEKKKNVAFLICVAIAVSFHTTAVFSLLLFLLKRLKVTRKSIIWFTIAAGVFVATYNSFFEFGARLLPQYSWYTASEKHGVGDISLGVIIRIGLLGAVVLWSVYLAKYRNRMSLAKNVDFKIYMAYIAFLFQLITTRMIVMNRIGQYALPFVFILVPDCIKNSGKYRKIISLGILAGMLLYFSYITIQWGAVSYGVVPYKLFVG